MSNTFNRTAIMQEAWANYRRFNAKLPFCRRVLSDVSTNGTV